MSKSINHMYQRLKLLDKITRFKNLLRKKPIAKIYKDKIASMSLANNYKSKRLSKKCLQKKNFLSLKYKRTKMIIIIKINQINKAIVTKNKNKIMMIKILVRTILKSLKTSKKLIRNRIMRTTHRWTRVFAKENLLK